MNWVVNGICVSLEEVIPYSVNEGPRGIPQLKYEIDTGAIERLSDTERW
jgi:hypothetical protein